MKVISSNGYHYFILHFIQNIGSVDILFLLYRYLLQKMENLANGGYVLLKEGLWKNHSLDQGNKYYFKLIIGVSRVNKTTIIHQ